MGLERHYFPHNLHHLVEEETSRSWLYFHYWKSTQMGSFDFFGIQVRWTSKNYYLHEYKMNGETVEVVSMVSYLRQNPKDAMEGVDEWFRGWSLTEYVYKGHSLFCLSHSNSILTLLLNML